MNLVPEHIDEAIKHLGGRSEEEMYEAWMARLEEIYQMDSEEAVSTVYHDIRDNVHWVDNVPLSWRKIASKILDNVDAEERKKAISIVLNDYIFG